MFTLCFLYLCWFSPDYRAIAVVLIQAPYILRPAVTCPGSMLCQSDVHLSLLAIDQSPPWCWTIVCVLAGTVLACAAVLLAGTPLLAHADAQVRRWLSVL